jgi:spermidine synthase
MQARFAGALVFVASGSVLVLEILAGRLLAPYVGVSLESFTGIIGVVLAGIAIGTWTGGWLADRADPRDLLPVALALGGGAAIAAVPIIRALGPAADERHPMTIVFLAAMAFFLPAALLSAVSPLTVKAQLRDVAHTGRVVGRVEAVGTAGSLVGVFGTGFILVAEFPTTPVVLVLGGLLTATGVVLWVLRRQAGRGQLVAAGALLAVIAGGGAVLAGPPCDVETAYFCARIEVDEQRPSARTLWLDDLRHAYVDLDDPTHLEFAYTRLLGDVIDAMAAPGAPIDAVHIGGGGFTIPRYVAATRPGSASLVLELDPGVVRLAERELGLRPDERLRILTGDARGRLRDVPEDSADLVVGDAFGGRAVPYHLTTREFTEDVRRVLRADGIYAQNIIDQPPLRFLAADVATVRDVFAHVAVLGPPTRVDRTGGGNTIVVASDAPLPLDRLRREVAADGAGAVVRADVELDDLTEGAVVLTDDFAPVDQFLT